MQQKNKLKRIKCKPCENLCMQQISCTFFIYVHYYPSTWMCVWFFPSSFISFASDQRPLPGPPSSTTRRPPGRLDCLAGTTRTPYRGGLLQPPCCWHAGIGYLCHSVWLQPLGDPYAIYFVTGYLHNAGGEGEKAISEIVWGNQTFPVDNDGRRMTANVFEATVNDSGYVRLRWPGSVTPHLLIDKRECVCHGHTKGIAMT